VIAKDSAAVDINVKCHAAPSPPPPGRVCVRSHGYFKNHPQVITNTVITGASRVAFADSSLDSLLCAVANQKCDWFPDDVEGIIRTIKQLEVCLYLFLSRVCLAERCIREATRWRS
jgi:hypothetical protein